MDNVPGQSHNPTPVNRHSVVQPVERKVSRGRRISKFQTVLIAVGAIILVALLAFCG